MLHCKVHPSAYAARASSNVHNIVCPVASLGADAQLEHIDRDLREAVTKHISNEFSLPAFGSACVESLLCESSFSRVGKIWEHFIQGQHLFWTTEEGVPMVKRCGEEEWEETP